MISSDEDGFIFLSLLMLHIWVAWNSIAMRCIWEALPGHRSMNAELVKTIQASKEEAYCL